MAGAQAFMEGWKRLLEDLGPGEIIIQATPADDAGMLSGTVHLLGGRRLDVYLRLEIRSGPRLARYSVQLLAPSGECLLRYDNAPHHSDLPGAPHHLHAGPDVAGVMPEPSLRTMIAAIRDQIER